MKTHILEAGQLIEFINPWKEWKHRMKWCELREYKWIEYVTIAVNRNLSNCEKARKKYFGASTGFEPVASALALQYSTSLSYEDPYTGGRPIDWVHQPVKRMKTQNEMMWTGLFRNCLNCDSLRWSHTQFICIPAVHIISFCVFIPFTGWWTQSIGRPPVYGSS